MLTHSHWPKRIFCRPHLAQFNFLEVETYLPKPNGAAERSNLSWETPGLSMNEYLGCVLLRTLPLDESWLQDRTSVGSHQDTPRRVPAALKQYVFTALLSLTL